MTYLTLYLQVLLANLLKVNFKANALMRRDNRTWGKLLSI